MNDPLIAILGPTAVGKSALALELAEELDGEIVSADSRQVYRGMDIGTAKPTHAERARVPHHLIDIVNPDEDFSLADYQHLAYETIGAIHQRAKVPFLVGGSGLYVRAVLDGLTIPRVAPNPKRRAQLERQAPPKLHARLKTLDPEAARRIDPRNARRVIRALEVIESVGKPISTLQAARAPNYRVLRIGLTMPRAELYERINLRVDEMLTRGLVEEVRGLLRSFPTRDEVKGGAMSGLGYRQITMYLTGKIELEEAVRLFKRDTRRFVHHQYSWFRLEDARIRWFDTGPDGNKRVRVAVDKFLRK